MAALAGTIMVSPAGTGDFASLWPVEPPSLNGIDLMDGTDSRVAHRTYNDDDGAPSRSVPMSLLRGALHRCPACGRGALYRAYLKVCDACPACGEELFHQRADDAPPYVTILVIGHLILGAVVGIDMAYAWPLWLHTIVWLPLTVALCLVFLPAAKGALVGLQWALRMHGFGTTEEELANPHALLGLSRTSLS